MKNKRKHFIRQVYLFLLILIGCAAWIAANWGVLSREYIFSHDSYYWYGLFHYFADSIYNGIFPLWNPYIHSGEMFFPYQGILLLLDPITLIGISAGRLFHVKDLFYLYEFITFIRIIIIALGVQLFLNKIIPEIKKYWYFSLFIILLSSFSINSFHQVFSLFHFGYLPFILLFLIKFSKNSNWINAIMLGYFLGISFQSYPFAAIGTFTLFFIILFLLFNRQYFKVIWNNKLKVTVCILLFIIFSAPAWSLFFYNSHLFPYSRVIFNNGLIGSGIFYPDIDILINSHNAFGRIGDFLSLGFLPIAVNLTIPILGKIPMSEINMYIAFIPFILGIIGIFKGKNRFKWIILILLFLSGLMFLGPRGTDIITKATSWIYKALFYALPQLRAITNTHLFATYFLFFYFYFVCLGLIFIISKIKKDIWKKIFIVLVFIITIFELNLYVYKISGDQSGGVTLLKRDRIVEDNIGEIDSYDVENIMLPNLPEEKKLIFLNYYEDHGEYYKLKEDKSIYENVELINILKKFFILGIGMESSEFTFVDERVKTVLPYSFSITREKTVYSSTDIKARLNFLGMVNKIPTAIDYFLEHDYRINPNPPPAALTMPLLYKNLLSNEIPQELKSILLGVNLPILEFYTEYVVLNPEEIIIPKYSEKILEFIDHKVILSNINSIQESSSNDKNSDRNYSIDVISYSPNDITLIIDAPENGILLYRDGYNPDWIATINGKSKEVIQANYNQKAVFIEKGIHEVEFIFKPQAFLTALYLYFIATAMVIIFLIYYSFNIYHSFYKKRKSNKT